MKKKPEYNHHLYAMPFGTLRIGMTFVSKRKVLFNLTETIMLQAIRLFRFLQLA